MLVVFATEIVDATGKPLSIVSFYFFLSNKLTRLIIFNKILFRYHGRPPSAAPATGSIHRYLWEQEEYLSSLFGSKPNITKAVDGSPGDRNHEIDHSKTNEQSDNKTANVRGVSEEKPNVGKGNDNFFEF